MKHKAFVSHPVVIVLAAITLLTIAAPFLRMPLGIITQIAIYTLYGTGVNLLLAYAGLGAFGSSVFFGTAGYAVALWLLKVHSNEFVALLMGVLFSGFLGAIIGLVALRRRGLYFSLLTLAFSQLAFEIAYKWTPITGGENGLQNVPRLWLETNIAFHLFAVFTICGSMYFIWRFVHAPFGRVLQGLRDNNERVRFLGYNTFWYRLIGFILMSAVIGYAGSLLTLLLRGVYANNLSWQHAGDALLMTILGGIHHFLGPLIGAMTFLVLVNVLSGFIENWWLVFAPIVVVFILLAPEGLIGLCQRLLGRERWTIIRNEIPSRPDFIPKIGGSIASDASDQPILQVRDLNKHFGALEVAGQINLEVYPRGIHSLIGPNGAGKTTFFNMLTGAIRPDSGSVRFAGKEIVATPVHTRVRMGLARSFQIMSIFLNLTTFDSIHLAVMANSNKRFGFWRNSHTHRDINLRSWSLLESVGLTHRAAELARNLSHGEQRLLEIALALATDAKMLLLDEPLAGLAAADREVVGALIREIGRNHAVLLIEHDVDRVLSLSDRITVLHRGRVIADGAPSEIVSNEQVIEAYLGRQAASAAPKAARPRPRPVNDTPLLRVQKLRAGYEGSTVLNDIDLTLRPGEVIALLGRNGVGKTTTQKAIMGTAEIESGEIFFNGVEITKMAPHQISRMGISVVPEGRRLFYNLAVWENLRIASRPGGAKLEDVLALFPRLRQRMQQRAASLSGGERQMLAIARSMMAPSRIILLDEPFEGLAPAIVDEVLEAVRKLSEKTSMLIIEHKAELVLPFVDRAYILVNGSVAYEGSAHALADDAATQARLLGLTYAQPSAS